MGRPAKLTEKQWDIIRKRVIDGEKAGDLAKEYGVSRALISGRCQKRLETAKAVANQLVAAETALRAMPVSDQLLTLNLADELRAISMHAAGAAKYGMATAHRLAGIAHGIVQRVDDADPMESMEHLKAVAVIGKIANDQAHIGLNLLAANKDKALAAEQQDTPTGLDFFYGGS